MKIVTSEQMRRIETRSGEAGVSADTLMERAGLEVARGIRRHVGHLVGVRVVVLVGPGNNGGDGLVAARHLQAWGARTLAYICAARRSPDPELDAAVDAGVEVGQAADDHDLGQLREAVADAHAVLDSVLGTGRSRPIAEPLRSILTLLSESRARRPEMRVFALDLPTGVDADTGAVDEASPSADVTITLGYPKAGLYGFPAADLAGLVETVDIGIPPGLDDDVTLSLITPSWVAAALPERPRSAHKGTFGRVMIVAGSRRYVGAAYLAAMAAARVGAGLVTLAMPESLRNAVAAMAPEPTYLPLAESSPGVVSETAAAEVLESLSGYDALLAGCGLGQAQATRTMVEGVLFTDAGLPPTVVDADGLNSLVASGGAPWWERFPSRAIVTPHAGEMGRLVGTSADAVQRDRIGAASTAASKWNKVVVLKGAHTVVAQPDGGAMISPFVNPALASAGTGDVLAGAIAGLLSQGLATEQAAALGVYLQGAAGERVSERIGDTGLIASDLLDVLPGVVKDLRGA